MPLSGIRVVILDEDVDVREVLALLLARRGADVTCARSANDAVTVSEEWRAQIVICDLTPSLNSTAALALQLKAQPHHPRCVLVTAHPLSSPHVFDGYLRKPIEIRTLVDMIGFLVDPRCAEIS